MHYILIMSMHHAVLFAQVTLCDTKNSFIGHLVNAGVLYLHFSI
jgi:hypothetical protein